MLVGICLQALTCCMSVPTVAAAVSQVRPIHTGWPGSSSCPNSSREKASPHQSSLRTARSVGQSLPTTASEEIGRNRERRRSVEVVPSGDLREANTA
jgi:hypothetical protein